MKALILGDSQSRGIGRVLAKLLRAKGWSVTEAGKSGAQTNATLKKAKTIGQRHTFERVYVFSGGNNSGDQSNAARQIVGLFKPGAVIWIGPPPATKITNVPLARKVFGSKVKNSHYWISSGFAAKRDKINAGLRAAVGSIATFADVRAMLSPFPPQPDGIHVHGSTATTVAKSLANAPFSGQSNNTVAWILAVVAAFFWWKRRKTT